MKITSAILTLLSLLLVLQGCAQSAAPKNPSNFKNVVITTDNYDGPYYYQQERTNDFNIPL